MEVRKNYLIIKNYSYKIEKIKIILYNNNNSF